MGWWGGSTGERISQGLSSWWFCSERILDLVDSFMSGDTWMEMRTGLDMSQAPVRGISGQEFGGLAVS